MFGNCPSWLLGQLQKPDDLKQAIKLRALFENNAVAEKVNGRRISKVGRKVGLKLKRSGSRSSCDPDQEENMRSSVTSLVEGKLADQRMDSRSLFLNVRQDSDGSKRNLHPASLQAIPALDMSLESIQKLELKSPRPRLKTFLDRHLSLDARPDS